MGPMLTDQAPYRRRPARRNRLAASWPLRPLFLAAAASLFAIAAAAGLWYVAAHSPFFRVAEVAVEGELRRLDASTVQELSGITAQTSLCAFSVRRVQQRLEAHPWIERARVERCWPDRVRLVVRERRPLALVVRQGRLFYVDRRGRIFAPVEAGDLLDYPIVSGPAGRLEERRAGLPLLQRAVEFLVLAAHGSHALPRQNISEMRLTEKGDWLLFLASRPFPIHLGRLEDRGTTYRLLAKSLETLYRKKLFDRIAYIRLDLRPAEVLAGLRG